MKNLTIGIVAILFLAVAGLYVMQFTGNKESARTETTFSNVPTEGIAYVNIDTVIIRFDMFRDKRNALETKQKSAEAELNSKGTAYERGIKDYQDKVSKGLVTRATAAEMENSLTRQQQELLNLRDRLQGDLLEEEQVMNRQIIDYITKFLEENKSDYNFQYVLGKSFGSVVLYSDPALDITSKVVAGINQKYKSEKK
jgi:outer membrane protein